MRCLFISYTTIIRELKNGRITENDLNSGLFYLGCVRKHAMNPGANNEGSELMLFYKKEEDLENRKAAHALIVSALKKAEREKRIIWRKNIAVGQSYKVLNRLLVRHGYSGISFEFDGRRSNAASHYCYPGVVDRIKEASLDLKVVS